MTSGLRAFNGFFPSSFHTSASAPEVEQIFIGPEHDQVEFRSILKLRIRHSGIVTAAIIVGDTALFGVAIWMFLLVYELSKLVALSMDRGDQHERAKIRLYAWSTHIVIILFLFAEITLAVIFSGYSIYAYHIQLSVYILQIMGFCYMIVAVLTLKIKGRDYESVHGHFVASPLYRRLKCIMLVYAIFVLQFFISSGVMYFAQGQIRQLSTFAKISYVVYYIRGFALSIVTGCSQICVVRCSRCFIPYEIQARYIHQRECSITSNGSDLSFVNPIFVYTDIESSSALWAIGNGRLMQESTQVHDDILRSLLAPYRGYEITTAGDSFQLAFHTIREATEYCLIAQLRLLNAKWPKGLHNLVPSTEKVRAGTKTIFKGLRVRMGIHDAVGSEGTLVRDVHVVTGKIIYTGASVVIAHEIGDLGEGGQILVTERIAKWLKKNSTQVAIKSVVELVREYAMPRLHTTLKIFQVVPKPLVARLQIFHSPQHIQDIESEESLLEIESQVHQMYILAKTPHQDRYDMNLY
ncbi:hypothetical protein CCR75_008746 [Bremia lactucae]|uniref:Guanylate cyclase domain-containing protein n=1 Tax=Bremia lactucae TaxID=4779 RepID=A0A976ICJ3_BRELC|nr:hypothetical protein CCR75_008746 [Bremia lactucae]